MTKMKPQKPSNSFWTTQSCTVSMIGLHKMKDPIKNTGEIDEKINDLQSSEKSIIVALEQMVSKLLKESVEMSTHKIIVSIWK